MHLNILQVSSKFKHDIFHMQDKAFILPEIPDDEIEVILKLKLVEPTP